MKKIGTIIDKLKKGENAPTRHHNPYLSEALELSSHLFTKLELIENFHTIFEDMHKPLVIEIGCYMGKNILEFASQNPKINFLGLDITYKRVVKAARKLKKLNLQNGKIAICDGQSFLNQSVPDEFLHGVCIFFPDPWPKDRHKKHRLLNEEFVLTLKKKISKNGFLWFKTDHPEYFIETEKILLDFGFYDDKETNGLNDVQPQTILGGPYESSFQKLFSSKGIPFYQKVFLKK